MRRQAAESASAARTLDRVATLVRAGITARRAWTVVAEREPALLPVARSIAAGATVAEGLCRVRGTGQAVWQDVAVLWAVAERTGSPVAPTLDALAAALRERADADRAVEVALAGPRASGRVVLALPVVGVLFGLMWGIESVRFLFASVLGWGCLVLAGGLVLCAGHWTRRLVARADPSGPVPGLGLELWAVALSSGGARSAASRVVAEAAGDRALPEAERTAITATLELADAVGVPAAGLLRAAATDVRRDTAADQLAAAERLGVLLVLPLGVCLLPAFVLVGIVPVIAGILSSTIAGLR
ncbi:type II secretion system F family protein [Curtobacterium sp. Leaf261]|uniref:type II secretion system F family protein n=1 Tax=Curtobacterium sp. Leaf261 TaxID=1736311 RepID=UPI0006FE27EF|nr:type II secretion system F family protein [Curtobacterium sp. Leaf261]KQO62247.1 hypothetical protein ASF23_10555 [Curtobacterium sp. Leaf261]